MSKVEPLNSFVSYKQKTNADIRQRGRVVSDREPLADSTDGQTTITLSNFVVDQDQKDNFMLYIDGKLLREGVNDDYQFTNIQNNQSATIELNDPIGPGLNIEAFKLGIEIAPFPNPSSVEARLNNEVQAPHLAAQAGMNNFIEEVTKLTPVNGAPGAGQYRSEIVNREPISDVENTLGVSLGIERIMPEGGPVEINDEFGQTGRKVFKLASGDPRIRFVGEWNSLNDTNGSVIRLINGGDGFIEVVFYGTGLNFLTMINGSARDIRATIDGSGPGSNLYTIASAVQLGANTETNQIMKVVSGLSLGFHTVKLENFAGSFGIRFQGIEILNESAQIVINPGTAYFGSKKDVLSSQALSDFDAGVAGIRGARVVKYLKDGAISQAVQEVNGSQANMNAADHSNEEVIRSIFWREFGRNRNNDFSTLAGTSDRGFTLPDGSTTLVGDDVVNNVAFGDALTPATTGDDFIVTFLGTGLDVECPRDDGAAGITHEIYVDAVLIEAAFVFDHDALNIQKIVSGLPYGTHTVRINRTGAGNGTMFTYFYIYGPKKPSLPSGAIEICDYNLVADYVATTLATSLGQWSKSTGVITKAGYTEHIYTGTWDVATVNVDAPFYFLFSSSTATDKVDITFWGTGFDLLFRNSGPAASATLEIDGVAYTGAATVVSESGSATWTPGTSTWADAGSAGNAAKLQVSGLTLGLHTVTLTIATGTIRYSGIDIQTPIHINDKSLKVGSLGLKDRRVFSPVHEDTKKELDLTKAKAWVSFDGSENRVLTSLNIAGVLDTGVGAWKIYYQTPFKNIPAVNVSSRVFARHSNNLGDGQDKMKSEFFIITENDAGTNIDVEWLSLVAFGELHGEGDE